MLNNYSSWGIFRIFNYHFFFLTRAKIAMLGGKKKKCRFLNCQYLQLREMTQMVNRIAEDMEWIETVSPTVSPQKGRLFLDVRSPKLMDALASPTKLAAEAKNSTSPFKTEENQVKTPLKEEMDDSSESEMEENHVKSKKESPKKEEKANHPKRKVCI